MQALLKTDLDLTLKRTLAASPSKVYRCWTEAGLITQWLTPPPWTTPRAQMDVRVGGLSMVYMRGPNNPDGSLAPEVSNEFFYLAVVPNERLVTTNALTLGFKPVPKPDNAHVHFNMVMDLHFGAVTDMPNQTAYTAICRHWDAQGKKDHEAMGFHVGWGIATDQLEVLAKTL
jgi:uncharacterized protein YndB with AHSA1/START domain